MGIEKYEEALSLIRMISVEYENLTEEDDDKRGICREIREIVDDVFDEL